MIKDGYKVTLLGQNVDSYLWSGGGLKEFSKLNHEEKAKSVNFAQLLDIVAQVDPELRIRFSIHPKDMTDDVLYIMAKHENICDYIHLPVQSGNNRILELMNRGYTREWYINRGTIKIIPDCGISMDIISGFCSKLKMSIKTLEFDGICEVRFRILFNYSERPNTQAQRKLEDVSPWVKRKKASICKCNIHIFEIKNMLERCKILVEGVSKKSDNELLEKHSNTVVVFPRENYKQDSM